MTYCVGLAVEDGLVMLSDSRTNAGMDHISTFRKMTVWERPGDRILVIATSGNLAITQAVISRLNDGVSYGENAEHATLMDVRTLREAAQLVGQALRDVYALDGHAIQEHGAEFSAAMLLGGQIKGDTMSLFHIYTAGNFIEATAETPFFQIGETKYGKPILDRVMTYHTSLEDTAKLALISMDSTVRSNISVGLPLDMVMIRRDELKISRQIQIDEKDPYFRDIQKRWSRALNGAFERLPALPW